VEYPESPHGLPISYAPSGFDVVETGNYDHFDLSESIVISRTGEMENALKVANALGIAEEQVLREQSPDFYLDVTLVIGSDYESLNLLIHDAYDKIY
jgi:hypothetical protein